jgi:hypothetical protein
LINRAKHAMFISFIAAITCFGMYLTKTITPLTGFSILIAIAISSLNFLFFVFIYQYSLKKTNKIFLIFNLGGMSLRLILTLSVIFISIKFLKIALVGFIFTLFIWYILLLIFEIIIIGKSIEIR